jgi:hypothetical protein
MSNPNKALLEELLAEVREVKQEMKEVRQKDLPAMREEFAIIKERTSTTARIYSGLGVAISAVLSYLVPRHVGQ